LFRRHLDPSGLRPADRRFVVTVSCHNETKSLAKRDDKFGSVGSAPVIPICGAIICATSIETLPARAPSRRIWFVLIEKSREFTLVP
jgi:hypothetical protein